jgi:5-formyltetrahydrofolate cyclo-ligase
VRFAIGVGRAFGFAYAAVDALVGMDDQHVVALVETIDRANLDAIHVFAFDAIVSDHVGHDDTPVEAGSSRKNSASLRKNERERLIAQRLAISNDARVDHARHIVANLDILLPDLAGLSVSLYWPFRGEPDLRGWAAAIGARGATCALPVVVEKNAPLVFRLWRIGEPLALGFWNIPFPANSAELAPDVVIAPVVGFDQQGYRLGYGGAFYDRTLAALTKKPRVFGIGYSQAAIATIYPLPHDIPMDVIVTEEAIVERTAS